MSNKIEGVPEGWELVGIRRAKKGEFSVQGGTPEAKQWEFDSASVYPIVRKLPEPLKIEAGKYYKQLDGVVIGPMVYLCGGGPWPWTIDGKRRGDQWSDSGKRCLEGYENTDLVEEVPAPQQPTHRPFASAEEFKPFRDKWIQRKEGDMCGCFRVYSYTDKSVFTLAGRETSYENLLTWKFEDGTLCGVKVS